MPDFRSKAEQAFERQSQFNEEQDYKKAFRELTERTSHEIASLKSRIETLEQDKQNLSEDIRLIRSQVEAGLAKLENDNKQLHTLIQNGQENELKMIQEMRQGAKDQLGSIMHLIENKGGENG